MHLENLCLNERVGLAALSRFDGNLQSTLGRKTSGSLQIKFIPNDTILNIDRSDNYGMEIYCFQEVVDVFDVVHAKNKLMLRLVVSLDVIPRLQRHFAAESAENFTQL
jgi:hypothetical protein